MNKMMLNEEINECKTLLKELSDELTIMNMINVLSNPKLSILFNEEKLDKIKEYVKCYVMQDVQKGLSKTNHSYIKLNKTR